MITTRKIEIYCSSSKSESPRHKFSSNGTFSSLSLFGFGAVPSFSLKISRKDLNGRASKRLNVNPSRRTFCENSVRPRNSVRINWESFSSRVRLSETRHNRDVMIAAIDFLVYVVLCCVVFSSDFASDRGIAGIGANTSRSKKGEAGASSCQVISAAVRCFSVSPRELRCAACCLFEPRKTEESGASRLRLAGKVEIRRE